MKALEVMLDGEVIGTFVPPKRGSFVARVGNIPREYMRVDISAGTAETRWHWQLPDVQPGQTISFRMVEAKPGSGVKPDKTEQTDPRVIEEIKKLAPVLMAGAFRQQAKEKLRQNRARKTPKKTGPTSQSQ